MLEVVALSALTTFLLGVGNGAAGEVGKNLALSAGALVRRTLGRQTPLPAGAEERQALAELLHARMARDSRQTGEWSALLGNSLDPAVPPSTGGMPHAPWAFTDRQKVLKQLMREVDRPWEGRPRVAQLAGPPGSGTTAVALRLGAEAKDRFADGQFYVDLRDGAEESGPSSAAVVLRLLLAMDVDRNRIPPTEAGRIRLYRKLTADRKTLVVIDHVTSLAQVRGLVPATSDVFLLVVVSGRPLFLEAERIAMPPLSDRHAKQLVRKVAGPEHAARLKAQLPGLIERCQGNAFALHAEARLLGRDETDAQEPEPVTGLHAHAWRRQPVHGATQHASLRLPGETARLCRLTALGGWPSISVQIAAAAADFGDETKAARLLAEAAETELLDPLPDGRYRFRPEIRRKLAETAASQDGATECSRAVVRVIDNLLHHALHAAHAALPESWRTEPAPQSESPGRTESEGVTALTADVANIVRAVSVAEEHQHITTALRLARTLWPLQLKAGYWDEILPALHIATRCADEHRADPRMAGALYFQLAHCLGEIGRWEQANRAARTAVTYEQEAQHLRGEASSVELLGLLSLDRWMYDEAYERFLEAEHIYRRITAGQEGAGDLPRALALAQRHQGRALRGLGRLEESRRALESAARFFAGSEERPAEPYNQARTLTDLAESLHDSGDDTAALATIADAEALLTPAAAPHLRYLASLRRRCEASSLP